ncbi:STAS domain-containing protein [soil metagenome]
MTTREIETGVRERDGVAVIDLRGEIDRSAEAAMEAAYAEAVAREPTSIVLNFAETDYINSTGIALIVSLLARARKDRRAVTACGLSEHYREIFEITRLADFMTIVADEAAAVEADAGTTPDHSDRGN